MRVAIADDDPEFLDFISTSIASAGFDFDRFSNGEDLLLALHRETYDVVVVDWKMPGVTGLEIVKWGTSELPLPPAFILITSKSDKSDVVRGLESGACDYIVKPESADVIVARIKASARQRQLRNDNDRYLEFGRFRIDRLEETIERQGQQIQLTNKEFKLAVLFFENLNRPLSRAYIFSQIWNGAMGIATRTLDMHVSRIRSKLELRPANGFLIKSIFGFGYRMDAFFDETATLEDVRKAATGDN